MLHKKTIIIISISAVSLILLIILLVTLISPKKNLSNLISLPLQKSSSLSDISTLLKNNIKTTITISDKKQELDLFLIPDDYTLFITQQDIFFKNNDNSIINKNSKNFYDYEYSQTVKLLTKRQKISFTHYSFARKAQENFLLCEKDLCDENSVKLNEIKFMLAEDPYDKVSGGIGLAVPDFFEEIEDTNFCNDLYNGKYINKKIWYINYDKKSEKRDLIMGKYPYEVENKYEKADFTFFDIKDNKWYLEMIKILIGEDKEENEENLIKEKKFIFSPDSSLILGPYEYYDKIKKKFFNKYFKDKICSEHLFEFQLIEYLYMTCNSDVSLSDFPPLEISINKNYRFELTYEDLFVKNDKNILFLLIGNKEERYSGKWLMGEPFLKKYMPVYNQQEKKIGFYNVIANYKSSYRILGIVGFIFFIIFSAILTYLVLYLYRKYKNKKIRKAAMEMKIEEISSKLVENKNGKKPNENA